MITSKDEARRWDHTQRFKRGYATLHESDLIDYIAKMIVEKYSYKRYKSKHPGDILSIDHFINKQAAIDPRSWNLLSLKEKQEWIEFIKEWEDVGRLNSGYFWIASGLQCKANLNLMHKRLNNSKHIFFDLHTVW